MFALAPLAIVVPCLVGKVRFVKPLLALLAAGAAVYLATRFSFTLASHDRVLAQGQGKYFCEVDCHLAYSVVGVKVEPEGQSMHHAVCLRTRFGENTISRAPATRALLPIRAASRWLTLSFISRCPEMRKPCGYSSPRRDGPSTC